jgi:hypothetical protein
MAWLGEELPEKDQDGRTRPAEVLRQIYIAATPHSGAHTDPRFAPQINQNREITWHYIFAKTSPRHK